MAAKCPVCGKPLPPPGAPQPGQAGRNPRPFCSERCRQVDLGRWLTGGYAIPAEETAPEEEER